MTNEPNFKFVSESTWVTSPIPSEAELRAEYTRRTGIDFCDRFGMFAFFRDMIEKYSLAERERCARIAEAATIPGHSVQAPSCAFIAAEIRKSGNK